MATNKRINGDYVITSIGATDDVIINTDRFIVNGDQDIFGTLETTGNIVSILAQSAIGSGNIISDGGGAIISRGLCWSTQQNPNFVFDYQ